MSPREAVSIERPKMAKKYYSSIISEDKSKMSNLPQEVIYRDVSNNSPSDDYSMFDKSLSEIDMQMSKDISKKKSGSGQHERY